MRPVQENVRIRNQDTKLNFNSFPDLLRELGMAPSPVWG